MTQKAIANATGIAEISCGPFLRTELRAGDLDGDEGIPLRRARMQAGDTAAGEANGPDSL